MMGEEEGNKFNGSEVIDPNMPDESEGEKEEKVEEENEKLKKRNIRGRNITWRSQTFHLWRMTNGSAYGLRIGRKKSKRVVMLRWHERFNQA